MRRWEYHFFFSRFVTPIVPLELRLLRRSTREIAAQALNSRRLRRIDGIDHRVAGGNAVVRACAVVEVGEQAAEVNVFERLEGCEQAIAGEVSVISSLLQDCIGDLGLCIAKLEETVRLLIGGIL